MALLIAQSLPHLRLKGQRDCRERENKGQTDGQALLQLVNAGGREGEHCTSNAAAVSYGVQTSALSGARV